MELPFKDHVYKCIFHYIFFLEIKKNRKHNYSLGSFFLAKIQIKTAFFGFDKLALLTTNIWISFQNSEHCETLRCKTRFIDNVA